MQFTTTFFPPRRRRDSMCPHSIQKHKHVGSCPDHAVSVFVSVTAAPSPLIPRSSLGRPYTSLGWPQCGGKRDGDMAPISRMPREIILCKQLTTTGVAQHDMALIFTEVLLLCLLSKLYVAGLSNMTSLSHTHTHKLSPPLLLSFLGAKFAYFCSTAMIEVLLAFLSSDGLLR